jgi:hypothetical protein
MHAAETLPAIPGPEKEPDAGSPWRRWRAHFERNRHRPLPPQDAPRLPAAAAAALAWSLARFQIGETGEGRIVAQIARRRLGGVDDDYRQALALFVAEEGRHARILAGLVHGLGGERLTTTWTERLFVRTRRLAGVRFKLLAMFAAEVVGAGFYAGLAARLPPGAARAALEQIAQDERSHLQFHRRFFALQAGAGWRRVLFLLAWHSLARAAALAVLWDHRRTLRTLAIPRREMVDRLERLVREGAR